MENNKKITHNSFIKIFLWTLLLPMVGLVIEFYHKSLDFSLENIVVIYNENRIMYLITLAPFVFYLINLFFFGSFPKNSAGNSNEFANKESLDFSKASDKLTGLKKEEALLEDLKLKDSNENIILCILNLSYFREINTLFGYTVGDKLIKAFAKRLVENEYLCYRLHGDEFAIVHYDDAELLEIDVFINYLFNLICDKAFDVDGNQIYLTINAGVAILKKFDTEPKTSLFENAYIALKYAKDRKIQYAFYNDKLIENKENIYSYYWKEKILTAIEKNNITAFYQPIVNNTTLYPDKYEALIRIRDSENIYISPYNFMMSSKKYGLYNHLSKLMIIKVFKRLTETEAEISVNISINDIKNISTMKLLINKLNDCSREISERLVFEILESEGIESYSEIHEFIEMVKKYGCKIAIDDFGSGYSNLTQLIDLHIDYIKIDGSIIKKIEFDSNSQYIVKLLVDFAKRLGIKTIAEYVSTREIFEKVRELGVDYSQGYYFSEPQKKIESYCSVEKVMK